MAVGRAMKAAAGLALAALAASTLAGRAAAGVVTVRLEVPAGAPPGAVAEFPVPPEAAAVSGTGFSAMALTAPDGSPVPFRVDQPDPAIVFPSWPGKVLDRHMVRDRRTSWVLDLGGVRTFDTVEIGHCLYGVQGVKRVRIDGAGVLGEWRTLTDRGAITECSSPVRVPRPAAARYVRIAVDDRRTRTIEPEGFTARADGITTGWRWEKEAKLVARRDRGNVCRGWRMTVPVEAPFDRVRLEFADARFRARVLLFEDVSWNDPRAERMRAMQRLTMMPEIRIGTGTGTEPEVATIELGEKDLFRTTVSGTGIPAEDLAMEVDPPHGRTLWLVIYVFDEASRPRGLRAFVSGVSPRLVFPADERRAILRVGGDARPGPVPFVPDPALPVVRAIPVLRQAR